MSEISQKFIPLLPQFNERMANRAFIFTGAVENLAHKLDGLTSMVSVSGLQVNYGADILYLTILTIHNQFLPFYR